MEEEVEPGDVVVVDDVEAVLDPAGPVQLLAECLQHLLELVLSRVSSPRVDPMLNDLRMDKKKNQLNCRN